jgi:Mrp family chromosome partitioning ATPase
LATAASTDTIDAAATTEAAAVAAPDERGSSVTEEVAAFLGRLETRLPHAPAAVQLTGPRGGEGTSTLARELARRAAARGTSVVLLRLPANGEAAAAGDRADATLADDLRDLDSLVQELWRSRPPEGPAELVLGAGAVAALRGSRPERERLVRTLKARFDLVWVDAPPVLAATESLLLAPATDGVVLVVEAEATRRPVARAAVERIRDSGAPILGMLFNKRRHHIPDALYRLL